MRGILSEVCETLFFMFKLSFGHGQMLSVPNFIQLFSHAQMKKAQMWTQSMDLEAAHDPKVLSFLQSLEITG